MSQPKDASTVVPEEFSCGFLILRQNETGRQFLLMQHKDRWDLPKGHVDPGETKQQCALRELWEETGIQAGQIAIDPEFQFIHRYFVTTRKGNSKPKELTIFLAQLLPDHRDVSIQHTEHLGSRWFDWQPPHQIEKKTIDDLLQAVNHYLESR